MKIRRIFSDIFEKHIALFQILLPLIIIGLYLESFPQTINIFIEAAKNPLEIAATKLYFVDILTISMSLFTIACLISVETSIFLRAAKTEWKDITKGNTYDIVFCKLRKLCKLLLLVILPLTLGEELIFRWVPLRLIPYFVKLHSTHFYILIAASSVVFGLTHLLNYQIGNRQLVRILPQILSGVAFSILFIKYGLLITWAVHFIIDVLAFTYETIFTLLLKNRTYHKYT